MIEEKTIFILGAGASKPYGYPTGTGLREYIIKEYRGDFFNYFNKRLSSKNELELFVYQNNIFVEQFEKSSNISIDLFLARNPNLEQSGKLAIIFSILRAEDKSKFREDINEKEDWYSYLFNRMTERFTKRNQHYISKNNVAFITFNYDRSLEHFLYESLKNTFGEVEISDIDKVMRGIDFIHIYGQVATLEWQVIGYKIEYKDNLFLRDIRPLSRNIEIIYSEKNVEQQKKAQELISNAEIIFFLGFGYGNENLEILGFPEILLPGQKIYGTALFLTDKEIIEIKNKFFYNKSIKPKDIILQNFDCKKLLREYL